jgi:hypothetical protein
VSPFLKHNDSFDAKILAILEISFDATCKELQHNPYFDQVSAGAAVADLIMKIACRGQSDPQKITALALAAFRSHCYGPSKRLTA